MEHTCSHLSNIATWGQRKLKLLGDPMTKVKDLSNIVLKQEVLDKRSVPSEFKPKENVCYYTPCAQGGYLIISLEEEVYFIQCTVNRNQMSTKKSFWKAAQPDWIPVLLTPFDAEELKEKLLRSTSAQLSNEFKDGKFYVADVSALLSSAQIDLFGGVMSFEYI